MFRRLLSNIGCALDRHEIPYMIIGGQALLLYGEPRLTKDIDVTLGVEHDEKYISKWLAELDASLGEHYTELYRNLRDEYR